MLGGVETAVRTDKDIISEGYLCCIEYYQIVICVEIVAENNVISVIAEEIRFNYSVKALESD